MGRTMYGPRPAEADSVQYRRSIWVVKPVRAGEMILPEHLAVLRPNYGLHPSNWARLLGMRAVCDLEPNTPMKWGYVK